jgi:hypothetical protein
MTRLLKLKGLPELLVLAVCCGMYLLLGLPLASAFILDAGLFVLFAITACIINQVHLELDAREPWINCILLPYTTLLMVVPYVLMKSGLNRALSESETESGRAHR